MVRSKIYNILFLCTGNSARSILAEAIVNRVGVGRFRGFSAGSCPQGRVNPNAITLLKGLNYPTDNLKSKDWAEFAKPDAPDLDFIITVCDHAANEMCTIWPGKPISAHWGLPDPASVEGTPTEIAAAFAETYRILYDRIEILVNLPLRSFNKPSLLAQLGEIAADRGE